jgi:hypothetical protein
MKISRIKFVIIFIVGAAVFLFATTLLLNQPPESIFGSGSVLSYVLSPVKLILMGPLLPFIKWLRQDPDTPPPFFLAGFAFYWTILALTVHYLLGKIKRT